MKGTKMILIEGELDLEQLLDKIENINSKLEGIDLRLSNKMTPRLSTRFITRQQAANLLGNISLPTLDKWRAEGIVKSKKIGNKVVIKEQDVMDLISGK